jgi:hypothetical protein
LVVKYRIAKKAEEKPREALRSHFAVGEAFSAANAKVCPACENVGVPVLTG